MDAEEKFYNEAARDVLKNRFKIAQPTQAQIEDMKEMLFHAWLKRKIIFDQRLTNQEKRCLLFASQGYKAIEIAEMLNIGEGTVRTHEREIARKLGAKNMKQAITIGLRYADIA